MKKTRILTIAALVAFALAGCIKDKAGGGIDSLSSGADAKMSISITLPGAATRAPIGTPVEGTASESAVNFVNIYVFNASGAAVAAGANTRLAVNTTNFTISGNTYTTRNAIETVAGNNIVYVGINIPAAIANKSFADEGALLLEIADVEDLYVADDFYMFSDATPKAMAEYTTSSGVVNDVKVYVDRIIAKVAVTSPNATVAKEWVETVAGAGDNYLGLELVYRFAHFAPYNNAKKSYIAPRYWVGGKLAGSNRTYAPGIGAGSPTAYPNLYTFAESNGTAYQRANVWTAALPTNLNDLPTAYIGENIPEEALVGNTSNVYVSTVVLVNKAARWDATLATPGVVYEDVTPYGYKSPGPSDDVWVVKKTNAPQMGFCFITDTEAKANDIANGFGGAGEATKIQYTKGWVHFPVYLDGIATSHGLNQYGVARNQFIRANVTGVAGGPGQFPGIPGDEKPEYPDPRDPDDPIDGKLAKLNVEVEVNPWDYIVNDDKILQ